MNKERVNKGEPLFKSLFKDSWDLLPDVLKKFYLSSKPYSSDCMKLNGFMDIKFSQFYKVFLPLYKLTKTLPPYEGNNIPTTVYRRSELNSSCSIMERHIHYNNHKSFIFRSKIQKINSNLAIESKFGFGWCCSYHFNGEKVILQHEGYGLYILGLYIPLPLTLLLGHISGEEQAITENEFKMKVVITHSLLGEVLKYQGQFKISDNYE